MRNDVLHFVVPPRILSTASAVGGEETNGPLGKEFDFHDESDKFGGDTWEHSEAKLSSVVFNLLMKRASFNTSDLDLLYGGDLQNQCVATSEGQGCFGVPFFGLYGACSTSGEGISLAAIALSTPGGFNSAAVITTSHFCAAERQYRTPLEYGSQRAPTAQWTATAGGGFLLTRDRGTVAVEAVCAGRIIDSGISDACNMGSSMAPAAADSLMRYFHARNEGPDNYDLIVTGDLGKEGTKNLKDLLKKEGVSLGDRHFDCGMLLYDYDNQDVHAGASGCGCSAAVLASHFFPMISSGKIKRMLFIATGALMSPSSLMQGGTISGVAPVVALRYEGGN